MIRCIAVDDEPLALDLLEDNIKQVLFLSLVKKCRNAFEAAEVMQKEQIDLIFLDIQMPGITGLQFLKSLPSKPMVIFITAYRKYALEGFDLDVIDYLVKPVAFERFVKAVNKAAEYHRLKTGKQAEEEKEHIFVHSEYSLVKIALDQITHIEGLKDYIKIYHKNAVKPVITRLSLKQMEETLPSNKFIRIHKSFIISIDKIRSIRNNRILLEDKELPLSEYYREAFFKMLDAKSLRF